MLIQTRQLAEAIADEFDLPRRLVVAIVQAESAGDPWATRYEPGYRWLWNVRTDKPFTIERGAGSSGFPHPRGVSRETEFMAQRTSWGLMQIMGAVAREYGFRKPFLSELCDPETGLRYGCKHLATLAHSRFSDRSWEAIAAAYNAGSPRKRNGRFVNQAYVDKIARLGGFR